MISLRSRGLPPALQCSRRQRAMMATTPSPPLRRMSSTQHHHHHHCRRQTTRGDSLLFHSSSPFGAGGIKLRGEASAVAHQYHQYCFKNDYNNYPSMAMRHFSTLNDDDDEFDLPPLDLTTPSLSIPLPPNLVKDKAATASSTSTSNATYDSTFDIPTLDLTSPTISSSTLVSPETEPETEMNTTIVRQEEEDTGGSSFLSNGIGLMKKQLDFGGGRMSSQQRGKLRKKLQKVSKRKSDNASKVHVVEKKSQEALDKVAVPSIQQDADVDRKELLSSWRQEALKEIKESYPSFGMGPPPTIYGDNRKEAFTKLAHAIQNYEKEFLSGTLSEKGKFFLKLKLIDLHVLHYYGVTPRQHKGIHRKKSKKEVLLLLRQRQQAYYAESAASSMDSSDDGPPPIDVQPSTPARTQLRMQQTVVQPLAVLSPKHSGGEFPSPDFIGDLITTQADGTILGHSGGTSVLSTVVLDQGSSTTSPLLATMGGDENPEDRKKSMAQKLLLGAIQQANAQSGATFVPLQVDYRERFHASGKIPSNVRRRDNSGPLSDREVLAARVIDRTIRPWLLTGLASSSSSSSSLLETADSLLPENIVVNCEVQSYDPRPSVDDDTLQQRTHADPTVLAINSTIAALYQSAYSNSNTNFSVPLEAAGCVKLAILRDGSVIFDPTPKELEECKLELLYAGTRDHVLMLEFSANGGLPKGDGIHEPLMEDPGVSESTVADAIRLAHEAIQPIIEKQEELREKYQRESEAREMEKDEELMTDEEISKLLGLESQMASLEVNEDFTDHINSQAGMEILDEANSFVWSKVEHVALKLFGFDGTNDSQILSQEGVAHIHEGSLLSKKVRGRRENVLQSEIARLLRDEFMPENEELAELYQSALDSSECIGALSDHIHEGIMKKALAECARRQLRSDGRGGLNVVRPISATAPILPDSVHGSALFSRGETQVLCTATVGAPKEGLPIISPYANVLDEGASKIVERGDNERVPVGSLRFLRSQAEMESDMNSRRVIAGREMTGDSGILSEVKRAFLHYDFPDFSTGAVKSRSGASANRRAIGHGNLAEKAILPVLPHVNDFPYTIRLTSEVTSSNGSSSMASACGSSLALLDAGVPLTCSVAGVSVGLAPSSDELLLDITGTEDHYGDMDFKICGTYGGVTAMQLDVKRPLEMATITKALYMAKEGRRAILAAMEDECENTLPGLQPRTSMKSTAPRVEIIRFDPNRKRDLIGPGGTVLRQLEERFNISLDLSQEGQCLLFGPLSSVSKAKSVIQELVSDVEEGGIYEGTVIEIKDFGAVIELLRNKEGLLHVSELADTTGRHPGGNFGLVREHLNVGDKIEVVCTKIDHVQGSIRLSRKKLLPMKRNKNIDTGVPITISEGSTDNSELDTIEEEPDRIILENDAIGTENEVGDELLSITQMIDIEHEGSDVDLNEDSDIDESDTDYDDNTLVNDDSSDSEDELGEKNCKLEAAWMQRFQELEEFKRINGHFYVSKTDPVHPQLGNWVHKQRFNYKEGKLPDHRVQMLNDIGFTWVSDKFSQQWDQRYNELIDFKCINGHSNVPYGFAENQKLGRWVSKQRQYYKKGDLPDDRVQRLNDVGFAWTML